MNIEEQYADLSSHYIEGFAVHGNTPISAPLISEILPGLWQGGCIDGVRLPDDFDLVISLYPWEKYELGPKTLRDEITAYDGHEVPDVTETASFAFHSWKMGSKVLIHCQAGLNRSGLVAAQVLMMEGYTPSEAIQRLRESRCPAVLCNPTFEAHLLSMERTDG